MPAVTADPATVPVVTTPPVDAGERPVRSITTAPAGFEGEGFPVRRAFAGVSKAALDPFVHMDQMGSVDYAPGEPRGTNWHPHRGFETVTYIMDGRMLHQDSHGGGGSIENGGTQWMTAGRGILHIETPPEDLVVSGGLFHGLQLWVNLPAKSKMVEPRYQNLEADRLRLDPHPHLRRPRHHLARAPAPPAVGPGAQRARLRAVGSGHRRRRGGTGGDRPAGRVRPR